MIHRRRPLVLIASSLLAVSCGSDTTSSPLSSERIRESAVQIAATGCRTFEVHGAGMMVGDGRVATVAHVVAGATHVEVRGAHGTAEATIVYFDPILDVAVLQVDPRLAPPIPIGSAVRGDHGTVFVYRDDAPVEKAAEVQRVVDIRTADIYGEGKHLRPGYELHLDIREGDSGAVVVVGDKAVALVWATSNQTEARAWAMRASLVADHLSASAPVDNGHCT
jgi:Trypsin-like peptidase domain